MLHAFMSRRVSHYFGVVKKKAKVFTIFNLVDVAVFKDMEEDRRLNWITKKVKLHAATFMYFLCDNYNSTKLCSSIVTARISNEKFPPFLRPFYGISSELKNDYEEEEEEEEKNNADPFFASK